MQKFKEFFINSFFCYLAIELVEEMLEEALAVGISNIIIKGASTLLVVSLTQSFKVVLKFIVKKLTYKEGNDKMNKLKTAISAIVSNKKSILATAAAALGLITGTGVIDITALPAIWIGSFNLTPWLYWGVLAVALIIGISGKGWETIKAFKERVDALKEDKKQATLVSKAKAEIKADKKKANQTQAQSAKQEAKRLADEQAKLEKENAEREEREKIDAIKRDLLAAEQAKNETKEQ